jgi:hypothetical protein
MSPYRLVSGAQASETNTVFPILGRRGKERHDELLIDFRYDQQAEGEKCSRALVH